MCLPCVVSWFPRQRAEGRGHEVLREAPLRTSRAGSFRDAVGEFTAGPTLHWRRVACLRDKLGRALCESLCARLFANIFAVRASLRYAACRSGRQPHQRQDKHISWHTLGVPTLTECDAHILTSLQRPESRRLPPRAQAHRLGRCWISGHCNSATDCKGPCRRSLPGQPRKSEGRVRDVPAPSPGFTRSRTVASYPVIHSISCNAHEQQSRNCIALC